MSSPVNFTFGNLPVGYCFPGPSQYATDLFALISAVVDSGVGFNFGSAVPAVENRNMPWVRTDSNGNLIGLYSFGSGAWVMPHPIAPASNFRWIWMGSEADLKTADGGVDEALSTTTGPFWAIDTGFSFRIPIGVGTNSQTFDGNPGTSIAVWDYKGAEKVQIAMDNMPPHSHTVPSVVGDTNNPGGHLPNSDETASSYDISTSTVGGSGGTALYLNALNPVVGVYFIKRTIRQYYTA